ncbi:ATP-binding cassette domain-containing protein [Paracoccaceae bacterium]|nr:ATP-binding cassette domain-containing protein [Paracoccaceae bacterium]
MSELGVGICDLTLSFGDQLRLDIPSLNLDPTRSTMILGPNGAGKSLLLRVMHGLSQPDTGTVNFPDHYQDPARQAMVFQRPVLLRRTALANISFALKVRGRSSQDAWRRAMTWMMRAELDHLANVPARRLSGGEQQRLCMARALALEPKILFLDEPCASLDPNATVAVEALVQDAIDLGVKVIMVTHDPAQAQRLGSEIVLMHQGRIATKQSKLDFFTTPQNDLVGSFLAGKPLLSHIKESR